MSPTEPHPVNRRTFLRATATAGVATLAGVTTPNAAWAAPGPAGQTHRPVDQRSIDVQICDALAARDEAAGMAVIHEHSHRIVSQTDRLRAEFPTYFGA